MLFKKTTTFNKPIDTVWQHLLTPKLLTYIASPMQAFRPIEPAQFPEQWAEGNYKIELLNFGVIPMGEHYIVIEILTNIDTHKQVRDNGHGKLIRKWDHLIELRKIDDNNTKYTDSVEIQAGLLTPFIWLYAAIFYNWRQHRWHQLVKHDFAQLH